MRTGGFTGSGHVQRMENENSVNRGMRMNVEGKV